MTSDTTVLENPIDAFALNKAKQDLIDAGLILEAEGLGDLTRGQRSDPRARQSWVVHHEAAQLRLR